MADSKDNDERGPWLRTLYEIAHAEIRWAKEQGWRVVNWALVLFGGLIAVAKVLQPTPWYYFAALALLVLLAAFFFVDDLHDSAALARGGADGIEKQIPGAAEFLRRGGDSQDHRFHYYVQLIILAMGFLLAILVLAFL